MITLFAMIVFDTHEIAASGRGRADLLERKPADDASDGNPYDRSGASVRMDDIFVARLMTSTLHTVSPETLVEDAARTLLDNGIGSVLVVDEEDRLEGILTTTDFARIVAESHPKAETSVSRYMTTDVVTASAQDSIRDVADEMIEREIHHVPVVDETDRVIGIITTTDLAAYISHVQTPSPS